MNRQNELPLELLAISNALLFLFSDFLCNVYFFFHSFLPCFSFILHSWISSYIWYCLDFKHFSHRCFPYNLTYKFRQTEIQWKRDQNHKIPWQKANFVCSSEKKMNGKMLVKWFTRESSTCINSIEWGCVHKCTNIALHSWSMLETEKSKS